MFSCDNPAQIESFTFACVETIDGLLVAEADGSYLSPTMPYELQAYYLAKACARLQCDLNTFLIRLYMFSGLEIRLKLDDEGFIIASDSQSRAISANSVLHKPYTSYIQNNNLDQIVAKIKAKFGKAKVTINRKKYSLQVSIVGKGIALRHNQWELIQLFVFVSPADSLTQVYLVLDGQYAPGTISGSMPSMKSFQDFEPIFTKELEYLLMEIQALI